MGVVQALNGHITTRSANSKVGGFIDEAADLEEVVEYGGVNLSGKGGVEVDVCETLEDLVGKLEPWTMKRRDIPPMPEKRSVYR